MKVSKILDSFKFKLKTVRLTLYFAYMHKIVGSIVEGLTEGDITQLKKYKPDDYGDDDISWMHDNNLLEEAKKKRVKYNYSHVEIPFDFSPEAQRTRGNLLCQGTVRPNLSPSSTANTRSKSQRLSNSN